MNPLRHQLHKIVILFVADQQVLECQVLHFSVTFWGLDHFLHIQLYHIEQDIFLVHLLIPM
jgi:hypothetical protein